MASAQGKLVGLQEDDFRVERLKKKGFNGAWKFAMPVYKPAEMWRKICEIMQENECTPEAHQM
jgi:hypothetical protein